ncbi:unnamed protein product [Vicia faba]|uniref:Replication protein A 70 kDa DNA-binding subunit B/D first OB fold domain-containing protein n=1 Tax=Vicia faba TaxID=3906 RepID=A0AAV1ACU5_VICFA|nr:unnamed protein product [Vicia faba]
MARPIEYISSIDDSKDLWKVAVRCKHLWSVTSSQNREHLELILFDSKLDLIQAIVPSYLVSKFKTQVEVGCSYIMQNFKVSSNDFSFKSTDHKFKLIFCGSTSVKKVQLSDIPLNHLKLIGINAIIEGKYRKNLLYDIIGGVTEISQAQIIPDNNKSKIVFSLTDLSKHHVQCTLWGKLVVQLNEYYTTHKADGSIVLLLMNARIKEPQGNYPLNVSNAWNGTKLLINDLSIEEVKNLKEKLKDDLPTLSSSSMKMETTNTSVFSDLDKFVWKAEVLSLSDIAYLQTETTCVTVATLEKFECGQSGWYYDGCSECTKSVTLKDGKFMCYSKHISSEPVPRFKLEVLASDGKLKYKFVFWDVDCVKLIGKSALQMKLDLMETGDFDPLEFPYELDVMLKKELAIRAVFQPNKASLSVIEFKADEVLRTKIKERFKCEEHTSKIVVSTDDTRDNMHTASCTPTISTSEKQSHADPQTVSDPLSITADYDPSVANSALTPSKRSIPETVEELDSAQLSSTKIIRDIKLEK